MIEGLDIRGSVVIDAPNVTLKNCKISDGGYNVVLIKPGVTGTVVQNCDVDNQGAGGQGIAGQGTFVSNNIHGAADGIDVRGDNTVIRDNFIHDMQGNSDSHFDGIQADGGFSNLTIAHNTVINEHGQTSAIMLDNYWGPIDNVTIDDNLLAGGGYTTYLQESSSSFWGGGHGGHPITNVTYSNNHVGPGQYGDLYLATDLGHSPTMTGNTQDGDSMLASLQMTGQPSSSADAGTGVSDPAPSPSHDSGTDSHDSGPVASGDQGSTSSGSDGASGDPGSTSDDSSANAGSSSGAGTGASDPAPSPSQDSGTDSHDSGPVASDDQGSASTGSGTSHNTADNSHGYPDATTTGVPSDVTLKQSGSLVITTPGAVIEGLDIRGSVVIDAPNVTLKNCKISDGGYSVVLVKPGVTGALVQNCEIDNQGAGGQGIAGQGTFVSNNIHGTADGIDVRGDNTVIRDNFIHDVKGTSGDGIQADGNFSNLSIVHNTVISDSGQTAIMLDNYWGPIDNVKIDDNLLAGGGYTVYLGEIADGQAGGGPVTNVSLTNNHIVPGYYGDMTVRTELGHDPVISGNTNDGDAMLASLQMTGQPSSVADAGTGVSDPAPSTSHDSGTDSHDPGTVASDDQGSGSDGASADPGSTSHDSSANAGSSNDAGTGVSDPAPSQDPGTVASGDQGSSSSDSDGVSGDPGSASDDLVTSPSDQNSSKSGSNSHDEHHHGGWHRSSDSASADSSSTESSGEHNGHQHWRSGKDGSGADTKSTTSTAKADSNTNAPAGDSNAGQNHAGTSHKAGEDSHGLSHDTFVFGSNFHDMVEKLQQRASHHDAGQVSKNIYDHFADALNLASKAGHDGVHAGASGDTLTFKDAKASNHHHNDFHLS
ncbi:MAG TPA: right-handed parallel beta-helix repeat-containing protein [Nitrospiraceae bacterium]|nr:right-handed parallel beta-helix repeat-containing protein [Nitrospiraceae bacterium]